MRLNNILNENQISELGIVSGIKGAVSGWKAAKEQNKGAAHAKRIVANLKAEFMRNVGGGQAATFQNLISFLSDNGLNQLENIPNPTGYQTPSQSAAQSGNQTPGQAIGPQPALTPSQVRQQKQAQAAQSAQASMTPAAPSQPAPTPAQIRQQKLAAASQVAQASMQPAAPQLDPRAAGAKSRARAAARRPRLREDEDTPLNNAQIDQIIELAVRKNYFRIRAAQQGQPVAEASGVFYSKFLGKNL